MRATPISPPSLLAPVLGAAALAALTLAAPASAFCGFYVASGDEQLLNQASKVVLARSGDTTVLTMVNDYRGDPSQFALVVPVPTVLARDQIDVVDPALIQHVEDYSKPRLVEYFDDNPCGPAEQGAAMAFGRPLAGASAPGAAERRDAVRVEARYAVGEYDIVILSADESGALETWLRENGYNLPADTRGTLQSYVRQNLKFFVARVNLERRSAEGFQFLRPLQVRYNSPKFMLPIRLGTVNATGPQELLIFALTPRGRVEAVNYRTERFPTDIEVPGTVRSAFGRVYQAAIEQANARASGPTLFQEYGWNLSQKCDPCTANDIPVATLEELGAFWVAGIDPNMGQFDLYLTRLRVSYTAETFPEDLILQETGDASNFQVRFVMNNPATGDLSCPAGRQYREELAARHAREATNLAQLTGWNRGDIAAQMEAAGYRMPASNAGERPWWNRVLQDEGTQPR